MEHASGHGHVSTVLEPARPAGAQGGGMRQSRADVASSRRWRTSSSAYGVAVAHPKPRVPSVRDRDEPCAEPRDRRGVHHGVACAQLRAAPRVRGAPALALGGGVAETSIQPHWCDRLGLRSRLHRLVVAQTGNAAGAGARAPRRRWQQPTSLGKLRETTDAICGAAARLQISVQEVCEQKALQRTCQRTDGSG